MTEIDEDHPIYKAIDRGGGQTCDIPGVLRELEKAGYAIVRKSEIERLRAALTDARQALANITVARTVEEAQTISRVAIGILNQQQGGGK